jgi:hypothetical protein
MRSASLWRTFEKPSVPSGYARRRSDRHDLAEAGVAVLTDGEHFADALELE